MTYNGLFSFPRKSALPPPIPQCEGLDLEKAMYVAGLIANLANRAAATGGFRGAIPAHPLMVTTKARFGGDAGARPDRGLTAIATADRASITVAGADAARLGFLGFSPLHKQANGYDPDWQFDEPDAAMTARCRIIGLVLDVVCTDNPGGSATISLRLIAQAPTGQSTRAISQMPERKLERRGHDCRNRPGG